MNEIAVRVQVSMRPIVALMLAFAVTACASQKPSNAPSQAPSAKAPAADPYANGHAIFMTGRDLAGRKMTATRPPLRSSCMACHNANGSGGIHLPDGAVSADLRHKALITDQNPPYTVSSLERAISTGVDNAGEKLDPVMPRWRMSKDDLRDVALYVYNRLK